jgi:hypothetical protein
MKDKLGWRTVQAITRAEKLLHRLDVAHRYDADKRPGRAQTSAEPLIPRLRRSELERLYLNRRGPVLPDDDDGRDDVEIYAHHLAHFGKDFLRRLTVWTSLWAPWMSAGEVAGVVDEVMENRITWDADGLGRRLGLTDAERSKLQIRTIGGIDVNKAGRLARRKEKRRLRCLAWRAARRTGRRRGRPKSKANALKSVSTTAFAFNRTRKTMTHIALRL